MAKLGLVVEGGGVRAIYAAGSLDVLHDLHLPLDGVIGVLFQAGIMVQLVAMFTVQKLVVM